MCLKSLKRKILLKSAGTIGINLMSSILLDKLDEMGDDKAELYLADNQCRTFNKEDVKVFLGLDETDSIPFVDEQMDCDDFAAEQFGKGLPLVWTTIHSLNWFIDEKETLWFVEPQTDKISQTLEDWQGWDVRFFLSR